VADKDLLVTVERDHIQRALVAGRRQQEGGGGRCSGLSRRALYRRLERLDLGATITPPRDPVVLSDDSGICRDDVRAGA
jgi:hypothetical protein